jgi:RNA polymerase-binding transcription factor DksA
MFKSNVQERRLQAINRKGWDVAQKLIELKANQDITLEELADLHGGEPGATPEERLRQFLDRINAARTRLIENDYGLCLDCEEPLDDAALDETPWVERCSACVHRAASV